MGISILEMVVNLLRDENFNADVAYPGQKYPQIAEPVAAVHIEKVDRSNLNVTLEVNIICPAAMGGTTCEVEALRATEALRWAGAVCVQNGCSYDGVSQVYVVSVLATFTGITEEDSYSIGPGFKVYIDSMRQRFAVSFTEEEISDWQAEYTIGETLPVGMTKGTTLWKIELEELIPAGSPETVEPLGAFEVRVVTDVKTESYYQCRWTAIRREFTKQGLRRIRKGIALLREEE